MQRVFKFLMLLLVVLGLTACKKDGQGPVDNDKDYLAMVQKARTTYSQSNSGNLFIEVINNDVVTTTEFIYNYSSNKIDTLLHEQTVGDVTTAAYVTEGVAYVNVNGEKTKGNIFDLEAVQIIEESGFNGVTEELFKTFDKSFFKALEVTEDKDGVVTFVFNKDKYVLDVEGLEGDEIEEAIDRDEKIKQNIKSIYVTMTYANGEMTKLESSWVTTADVTNQINMELKGIAAQTITFPTDLDTYVRR